MNPVFIFLVAVGAGVLWFLLSFLFRPLGNLVFKIWRDAVDEIKKEDEEKEDE